MDGTSSSLREHLEVLPQELHDNIYHLTFTAEMKAIYVFHRNYHPPHLLQVDRHSREKFTASYYGSTTFLFTSDDICARWTDALRHVPSTTFRALYLMTPVRTGLGLWSRRLSSIMARFQEVADILRLCGPNDTEFGELMIKADIAGGQS